MEKFNLGPSVAGAGNSSIENTKVPSENIGTYNSWWKKMVKDGVLDINKLDEISYIKQVIKEGTDEDAGLALLTAANFADTYPNLNADLFSKKGELDRSMDIIIDNTIYRHRDNDMANSLKYLFSLHPEVKNEFIEKIKKLRPEFYNNLPEDLK